MLYIKSATCCTYIEVEPWMWGYMKGSIAKWFSFHPETHTCVTSHDKPVNKFNNPV